MYSNNKPYIFYKTFFLILKVFFISCLISLPALAIDPNSKSPIEIESDQATLDDKTGSSTYSGNVIITQGLSRLEADLHLKETHDLFRLKTHFQVKKLNTML